MGRTEAVIVATARTPMGRYGGQLKDVRPDDLAAIVLKERITPTRLTGACAVVAGIALLS